MSRNPSASAQEMRELQNRSVMDKDEWIERTSRELREGDPVQLVEAAKRHGVPVDNDSRISALAEALAHKLYDSDDVGDLTTMDPMTDMDSGPMNGVAPHPAVEALMAQWEQGVEREEKQDTPEAEYMLCRDALGAVLREAAGAGMLRTPDTRTLEQRENDALGVLTGGKDAIVNITPMDEIHSVSALAIVRGVVPKLLTHWCAKNKDYGDHHRQSRYGLKGELIGLDRKMTKLYNALWLEQEMAHEGVEEMLLDLGGQVFLMLDLLYLAQAKQALLTMTPDVGNENGEPVKFDEDTMVLWATNENGDPLPERADFEEIMEASRPLPAQIRDGKRVSAEGKLPPFGE